jgi:hypothetical protein
MYIKDLLEQAYLLDTKGYYKEADNVTRIITSAQGIITHEATDQEIDALVDSSLIDNGETYLINQSSLKNGLMSIFPNLKDVEFENMSESFGEYILELSAITLPTEIAKTDVPIFKATLHHELQHVQDPRMQNIPEKVRMQSDESNLANYIGLEKINENTIVPSYKEIVERIFQSFEGRNSTPEDEEFLNEIRQKYTPEKYHRVIERMKAGDHPYLNAEVEKPANLKDFKSLFSIPNIMSIKNLISTNPSYDNQHHIKTIINILRKPSSPTFKKIEELIIQKNPSFAESFPPSFLREMNTNPKYEIQFKKQVGNIINNLQQLLESEKGE